MVDAVSSDESNVVIFHEVYAQLLAKLPASVQKKIAARAAKQSLDVSSNTDGVHFLVQQASDAYIKKKEASKLAAAKRRAAKKAEKTETTPEPIVNA